MICRYDYLSRYPSAFLQMTGLRLHEFADLRADILPRFSAAEQRRLARSDRQRALGGGRHAEVAARDQILLTVVWLRQYPTNEVLGFLFGISDSSASRIRARVLPLLEAAGHDTMRMPDPGKKRRKSLDRLLADTPALAVIIDTFEQRVMRPRESKAADAHYSGKKKQHTLKSQVAVNEETGEICDVAESVVGPTADLTLLKQSALLTRLPEGVGALAIWRILGLPSGIRTAWVPVRGANRGARSAHPTMCASTAPFRGGGSKSSTQSDGCDATNV